MTPEVAGILAAAAPLATVSLVTVKIALRRLRSRQHQRSLARISALEHDLGLTPCSDPDCWRCDTAACIAKSATLLTHGILTPNEFRATSLLPPPARTVRR